MIDLLKEILELSIKTTHNTKHEVFFRYSPHVEYVEVDIYENGWESQCNELKIIVDLKDEKAKQHLKRVKEILNDLIETKQLQKKWMKEIRYGFFW